MNRIHIIFIFGIFGFVLAPVRSYSQTLSNDLTRPIRNSSFGTVPGHWTLNKDGFRDQYVPDTGYGNGVFAVALEAPTVLALALDSDEFTFCQRVPAGGSNPLPAVDPYSRAKAYPYKCESQLKCKEALFIETDTKITGSEHLDWVEVANAKAPFKLTWQGKDPEPKSFYYERVSSPRIMKGEKIYHGAWISGRYPPQGRYFEEYDQVLVDEAYTLFDRAIYTIGPKGLKYFLEQTLPVDRSQAGFALAFLPPNYSDFSRGQFSYIYEIPNGFWLRVDLCKDHEGAGRYDQVIIFEFKNGPTKMFSKAGRTRMY